MDREASSLVGELAEAHALGLCSDRATSALAGRASRCAGGSVARPS